MSIALFIQLMGGVGIFLYAIRLISDSLQLVAGDKLRMLIGTLTRTVPLGVLVGVGATVLVQSSTATTVMTVSFVDAGFMSLTQAISVIMGANIGTTVIGQILAIRITDYIYVLILVGVLLSFFCKTAKWRNLGKVIFGLGLLLVGMQTMENSTAFLRDQRELFLTFGRSPWLGVLAGAGLTLVVQSSAATVGLAIALGSQGVLPLECAIPIVLGDNIGTTMTAIVAAIGAARTAQQACIAHVLFNVIGVAVFLPLMPLYIDFIRSTADSVGHQIANVHSLFNICTTLLMFPFVRHFANLIRCILPDREKVVVNDNQYLDPRLVAVTPVLAVNAVRKQCVVMGGLLRQQLDDLKEVFFSHDEERRNSVVSIEARIDAMHKAIGGYADDIVAARIPELASRQLHAFLVCAGDMERIGDLCIKMLEYYEERQSRRHDFSPEAMRELQGMYDRVQNGVNEAIQCLELDDPSLLEEVERNVANLRAEEHRLRRQHMDRLAAGTCNAATGLVFIEVLGTLEHMGYRARKVARAVLLDEGSEEVAA